MHDRAHHAVEEGNVAGTQGFAAGQELGYALRVLCRLHQQRPCMQLSVSAEPLGDREYLAEQRPCMQLSVSA